MFSRVVRLFGVVFVMALVATACVPPPAPSGGVGSVEIEYGQEWTNTRDVVLMIGLPSGAQEMRVADGDDPSAAQWEPAVMVRAWSLPPGDGSKVVSVQFKVAQGDTAAVSDAIVLDMTQPVVSIDSHTEGQVVDLSTGVFETLSGQATDTGSGVDAVSVNAGGEQVGAEMVQTTWVSPLGADESGTWQYSVNATDKAGNSAVQSVTLTMVLPPPGVTIVRPGVLNLDESPLLNQLWASGSDADQLQFVGDQRAALSGVEVIVSSPIADVAPDGLLRSIDEMTYDAGLDRTTVATTVADVFDVYAQLAPDAVTPTPQRAMARAGGEVGATDRCDDFANEGTVGTSVGLPEVSASFPVPFPGPSNYSAELGVEAVLAANLDLGLSFDIGWRGVKIKDFHAIAGVLLCGRFDVGVTGDIENVLGPQFETGISEANFATTYGISDISVLSPSIKLAL